ncbi:MAG TPA: 23S ribosomal RNA methyltransferase Erm [Ktedonobacterales bacterium]
MSTVPLRYSQNFLRDPRLVERLIVLSCIRSDDLVVEIGPGAGALTDCLARRCGRVVAVELDASLARRLMRRYAALPHVTIQHGDFLDFTLPSEPYKVFASIPFARTHDIMTKLTATSQAPEEMCLIMQREAAEKFCGAPRECLYSMLLKPWFTAEITHHFRRSDFIPAPGVDVVLLRMEKRGPPLVAAHERQLFRDFLVYGFTTRQPTLALSLRDLLTHRQLHQAFTQCALAPDITPSRVTFSQWLALFHATMRLGGSRARDQISGGEQALRARQAQLRKRHRTTTLRGRGRYACPETTR